MHKTAPRTNAMDAPAIPPDADQEPAKETHPQPIIVLNASISISLKVRLLFNEFILYLKLHII